MFTIKVIDKYGDPAYYKEVCVLYEGGFLSGGYSPTLRTDRSGGVHFDEKDRRGEIFIEGRSYGSYQLERRIVLYMED